MKTLLIVSLFIVSLVSIQAQNKIKYTYDTAGNLTSREIIISKTKSAYNVPDSVTVINDIIAERKIKMYPNPTLGQLKVEIGNIEGIKNCTIMVTAMNTGKLIMRKKATLPITDIDISNQPFGFYIMVIDIDGEIASWKLIKQ